MVDLAAAVVDLDFDAARMVATSGSTEPVSVFDINGPAPWLYLDLPDGALTSFLAAVHSDWFHEGSAAKQFTLSNTSFVVQDEYWFSPTTEDWNATKAVGDWHIDAHHSARGVDHHLWRRRGANLGKGKATIDFTISSGMTGDFNNDGSVDTADYLLWRKSLGQTGANLAGDGNADNQIDDVDYAMWRSHYGETVHAEPHTIGTAPEPLAAAIVVEGILLMLSRRRAKYSSREGLWLR